MKVAIQIVVLAALPFAGVAVGAAIAHGRPDWFLAVLLSAVVLATAGTRAWRQRS